MNRSSFAFADFSLHGFALWKWPLRLVLCLLLGTILLPPALRAQTAGTGAIAGSITDQSGASVAEAQVKATNEATGEVRTAVSTAAGNYTMPLLLPGLYSLEISKPGFKLAQVSHVSVVVTETTAFNVRMDLGQIAEKVIVEAQTEQLQTQSSALGDVTSGEQIRALPLVTRNYTQIIGLSPGVAADVTNAAELGRGSGGVSDGAPVSQGGMQWDNNFHMDGVEINDLQNSGALSGGVAIPNPDAVQEFKVQTGLYDASYGGHAGANVNLVTKSGTNQWHGTAFEYFRNDDMNANDFFRNKNKQPRGVLKQNQFGFAAGGPIKKDKLLFFTSYQGTRQRNGLDMACSSTVNSPPLTNDRSAAALGALFAGQTGAFGGTAIAADGSNISSQALALLNAKLPNGQFIIPTAQTVNAALAANPATLDVAGQSSFSVSCPYTEDQFVTNADFIQSQKSKFTGRFFFANSDVTNTFPFGNGEVPGTPRGTTIDFRNVSITWTYVFSSSLVNEATVGYHRLFSIGNPKTSFTYASIGASAPEPDNSFPVLLIADSNTFIGGNGQAFQIAQNSYDFSDSLFYTHGKHSFHFGGGLSRVEDNFTKFHFLGLSAFLSFPDFLLGLPGLPFPGNNGTPVSNIIESEDFTGLSDRYWRVWDNNLFAQDDFKLTSRLTLNLGFRYDHIGDLGDNLGRNSGFFLSLANPNPPATGTLAGFVVPSNFKGTVPAGVTKIGNNLGVNGDGQDTLNPRVGFAWQLPHTNRFVLRGGYGIFHSQLNGQPFLQLITAPPFGIIRTPTNVFPNDSASWAVPFQPFPVLPQFIPYSPTTNQSITTFAQNYRPPRISRYGLNVQTQLANDLVLEVGYVGARGQHLLREREFDQASLASAANPIRGQTTNTVANVSQRAPLLGFSIPGSVQIESAGASWYNALETSLNKRFAHGLQFLASYTFSKDLATDPTTSTGVNGGVAIGNQNDPRSRYGPDSFTRPHRFIASYLWELPGPKNRKSLVGQVLGGWQLAGVTTVQSGHNLTLVATNATNAFGVSGPGGDRAELLPNCQLAKSGSIQSRLSTSYFNTSCVTSFPVIGDDGVATGFGNSGVGILRGPDQNNYDLSLIKRFPLHREGMNLEFRSEFFDAFNHPQFADPTLDVTVKSAAGQITSTSVSARVIQLALKLNF